MATSTIKKPVNEIAEIISVDVPISGLAHNAAVTQSITFGKTYPSNPYLICIQQMRDRFSIGVMSVSTTGASISVRNVSEDSMNASAGNLRVYVLVVS